MKSDGQDHLSKAEISKDAAQAGAEAAIHTVGEVATIITGAVKEVAGAIGGLATELFEIRDASRRAMDRHVVDVVDVEDDEDDDLVEVVDLLDEPDDLGSEEI